MSENLITKKQLAEKLGVTEQSINNYLRDGLPKVKFRTGAIRFEYTKCLDWLKGE